MTNPPFFTKETAAILRGIAFGAIGGAIGFLVIRGLLFGL